MFSHNVYRILLIKSILVEAGSRISGEAHINEGLGFEGGEGEQEMGMERCFFFSGLPRALKETKIVFRGLKPQKVPNM